MKTENKVYDAPQVEIVEIEVEQAVLTGSQNMDPQGGNWI
jgi:hypothetical protein